MLHFLDSIYYIGQESFCVHSLHFEYLKLA